ncbi:M20/M25/M40 family metallo-hydrolase [Terribacillus saccharophilus]|uniref:M20/M25/M40 family metallo-hydrolase n=1 Tax=Terribacillus saccharophilus TaxID=361277 RepID=UPI002989E9F0|nr:M20/M25/M40 family metallo-hydrolase [Terribacillus saccharophilus]MCM3226299.1 M20/M25/M40 family metallo-hydrolase [Terribacillus saccharophilus]
MQLDNQEFLMELLRTASPSSYEMDIQKKWMKEYAPYADEMRTDVSGNAIAVVNPDAEFKVLLAGHCDEIAMVVTGIDQNGFLQIDEMGRFNAKAALGMTVQVIGYNKTIPGVVGVNAMHLGGVKGDFELPDLYIDCGAKSKQEMEQYVQVGDLIVYQRQPSVLMDRYLTGRGLDNRTGSFIVGEVVRRLKQEKVNVGVYAVSTVNEETNMGGAYFAAAGLQPDLAIACDVTFATDHPGVNKRKAVDVSLDGGPVLAKGAPINRKANILLEQAAKELDMSLQYELTPRATGTDADKMRYSGKGVSTALVSLPLRYMHSPVETVSLQVIQQEIDLLVKFLTNLTGEESLNPLDL